MFIGLNDAREHFFYRSLFTYLLLRKPNASKDTSSILYMLIIYQIAYQTVLAQWMRTVDIKKE